MSLREFLCRAECLLYNTSVNYITKLSTHESRTFSRFYMLKLNYLVNNSLDLYCKSVSEITC